MENREVQLLHLRVLSPLHAGAGSDIGYIDLPIQREKQTNFPKIEASSLKGCFRSFFTERKVSSDSSIDVATLFGKEDSPDFASALSFLDAKLLFFAVRSFKGVYQLATCPEVINKYFETMKLLDINIGNNNIEKIDDIDNGCCIVSEDKKSLIDEKCIIEDLCFSNQEVGNEKYNWFFDKFKEKADKIIILSNDIFKYLTTLHTEVITRNKIDATTGTCENNALFNEEYVPTESVFYTIVIASKSLTGENPASAEEIMGAFAGNEIKNKLPKVLQIGGNSTIGKGLVEIEKVGVSNA